MKPAILHAFGEILIDAVPSGSVAMAPLEVPMVVLVPGGAPANVAVQVARLGGRARLVGGISTDPWGDFLRNALRTFGVEESGLVPLPNPTALAVVQLSSAGERSFRFFRQATADLAVTLDAMDFDGIGPGDVAHACSNCLTEEPARSVALEALDRARARGALVCVDPNLRPMLWTEGRIDFDAVNALLDRADIVKAGAEEAVDISGSVEAFVDRRLSAGARCVVLTDGPGPVRAWHAGDYAEVHVPAVQVVDTTGAGDAFCGGLIHQLLRPGDAKRELALRLADAEAFIDWLRFASVCGALTTMRFGAMTAIPDQETVRKVLEGLKKAGR